jgi:uncharacterized protein YggE
LPYRSPIHYENITFVRRFAVPVLIATFSARCCRTDGNQCGSSAAGHRGRGQCSGEAAPDQAVVRIGVVHQSASAKEAQDEANKVGQAINKAILALGVTAKNIQTSRLSISPVYVQQRPGSNDAPRIAGYTASSSISITLENLAQVGPVVDAGLDNGANQLDGVRFQLKNDGPMREEALKLAVEEAKGKAAAIAKALGVTLGPVMEVSESGVSVSPLDDQVERPSFRLSGRCSSVATPVSPGEVIVNAQSF